MKILIECLIPNESGPMLTYGIAKALTHNGEEVYAIIPEKIENKNDWDKLLPKNNIFYLNNNLELRSHPIRTLNILLNIRNKFHLIYFDAFIDTFPSNKTIDISHFINYKASYGIDHDVIAHSSTDRKHSESTKKTISNLDNVIVMSKSFISIANDKYHNKKNIYYMKHGAMEYPHISSSVKYDNKYDINFLYFGRIDGYKGLHVLAKAYSDLSNKYHNISITVAGNGDFSAYQEDFRNLSNCCIVNKYITDEEIAYYFSKPKTVVVLPYLDATQSGVIAMAFNYKTPVVVSDTGGLKEQLFDGKMGLFAEPGNPKDLAEKMERYMLDKNLYYSQQNLMTKGYEKSTWDYTVKEFLKQIE